MRYTGPEIVRDTQCLFCGLDKPFVASLGSICGDCAAALNPNKEV